MIVERYKVAGFEMAIRGMREAFKSIGRSDSEEGWGDDPLLPIGEKDLALARKLVKSGPSHRKFMRQIVVWAEISAPRYWWTEFDTYKVGTSANSESTMHTIMKTPFTEKDFFVDDPTDEAFVKMVARLNELREEWLGTKDKGTWRKLIQMLPQSYRQKRMCMFSYENALAMIEQRSAHKLNEWRMFCHFLKELPLMRRLTEVEEG